MVITTWPAGPAGHRFSRSAGSVKSSRTSAHGRLVLAIQAANRSAAASAAVAASAADAAPTACAASAKPVMIASRLAASTQTRTSTARMLHSA